MGWIKKPQFWSIIIAFLLVSSPAIFAGWGNFGLDLLDVNQIVVEGNTMFAATGVTKCDFLNGVRFVQGGAVTHSLVVRSKSGTERFIRTNHYFDKQPDYT